MPLTDPFPNCQSNALKLVEFVDLKTQYRKYQTEIDDRMRAVLTHGHFIMGPEITELEAALAKYVGVKHCITVASGTASLEVALRALGVGPGGEVVTVPFTWISSAEVIRLVGAKPVFVDIEAASYNINVAQIEAAITSRTKAILPVSLFGQMPDYDRINAIAAKHKLAVIEDGAQSFGATQSGRRSCGVTLIGSTSFFPAKPLGCYGDGGALFTNDDALAEKMRAIRTHGALKRHNHPFLGMNGRFDTLQAAVVLAKLPHFAWEVEARGRIDDGQFLAEAQTRTHQRIQLTRGLERVQPPDRAQHARVHLALLAKTFDDLQVGVGARAFDSKIHRAVSFPLLTWAQCSSDAIANHRTLSACGATF